MRQKSLIKMESYIFNVKDTTLYKLLFFLLYNFGTWEITKK